MIGGNFLLKITDKWPAKVISLAAALIIFVFYRVNSLDTRVLTVPLKVETAESFIPSDSVAHIVRVTLRGEANNILTIMENDIEAYIDLNRYSKEGTYRVPVQLRKRGNALGVEPLEISVSPMEVYITLEEKVSRFVHVFPVFTGIIAAGFEMTSQSTTPESVIAEGPRSSIDNLKEFFTDPIDIENRNSGFTILVPIKNDNPNITIHGSRMIEYSCSINSIQRAPPVIYNAPYDIYEGIGESEE